MLIVGSGAVLLLAVGAVALASDRADLQRLNLKETAINAEQGQNLNRLSRLLTILMQFRRDPPPALLVSPDDAVAAVRTAILVRAITPELERRAATYAAQAREVARQRRLTAVASAGQFASESDRADLSAPPPQPGAEVFADDQPTSPPSRLLAPAPGPVTKVFGSPLLGGGGSNGLTLAVPAGSRVVAPDAGRVEFVGPIRGWGVILILRLSGGYHLVLGGLDRASVEPDQPVSAGTPVGWMADGKGATGELYLELRNQGVPIDPARWLSK